MKKSVSHYFPGVSEAFLAICPLGLLWVGLLGATQCSPNDQSGGALTKLPAVHAASGHGLYTQHCEPCHRPDGQPGFYGIFLDKTVPRIAQWPMFTNKLVKKGRGLLPLRQRILHPLGYLPAPEVNRIRREVARHQPEYSPSVRNCLICHRWGGQTPWPNLSPLQSNGRDFLQLPFQGLDAERLHKLFERSRTRTIFLENRRQRHFSRKLRPKQLKLILKWLKKQQGLPGRP